MRIALVNPVEARLHGYQSNGSYIPQLGLQVLAQQTPTEHSIDIIDEIFGQHKTIEFLQPSRYDLVGITAYTCQATRAYELANYCQRLGILTVMGGPHASAMPDEAGKYVNSVVVGEADEIWPRIIADATAGKLKNLYSGKLADLGQGFGVAAQYLQPVNGRYDVGSIQTSRGCPVGCEYCSVTSFNGAKIRRRPISDIVDEWHSTPHKFLFVVDDNFFGVTSSHAAWAKDLLRHIIKYGKKRLWFSQTTINMGDELRMNHVEVGSLKLSEFLEDSLSRTRGQIRENTYLEYDSAMRQFIEVIGNIDYLNVRHEHGERFIQTCLDGGNRPATVAKKIGSLKRLFQLAVERSQLENNPFEYVRKPKVAQRAIHVFSDDECNRMVKAARQTQIGTPFRWDIFSNNR